MLVCTPLYKDSVVKPLPVYQFYYLHGFNSSPQAAKAQELATFLQEQKALDYQLLVPQLSSRPAQAVAALQQSVAKAQAQGRQVVLWGSSLGGFYATYLSQRLGCRAILINPVVAPWTHLSRYQQPITNPYSGETYCIGAEHLAELQQLALPELPCPQNLQVWLQKGDEVLDYRQAAAYYQQAELIIQAGGDHRFQNFYPCCPRMLAFAQTGQ